MEKKSGQTIIISSFHPLISRNIIGTRIPKLLAESGARVVVVMPEYKKAHFEAHYHAHPNIEFRGISTGAETRSRWVQIAKKIAEALPNTKRAAIGRRRTLSGALKPRLHYIFIYMPIGVLGKSILIHRLFRWIDRMCSPRGRFDVLLNEVRPDVVFSTDIQNEHDVALMRDAARKKIAIVGMVRSWDNLTTRALRVVPEKIIVWNEIIKDEAVRFHGVSPNSIRVVGIPHYDYYRAHRAAQKEEFVKQFGLDANRPIVLFFPLCDYRLLENDVDRYVLETLAELPVNVIVRFPPAAEVTIRNFTRPAHIAYDHAGEKYKEGNVGDRDLTPQDDERLMNELALSDVVVAGPSTAAIDAALFDKPMVLVDFYPRPVKDEERIYEYKAEHIERILAAHGTRTAQSREEFITLINEALKYPERDKEGRKRIVEEQCAYNDMNASGRIAKILLEHE